MAWGDERLDKLNDFIVNDPLYARLDLAQLFDLKSLYNMDDILNLSKVYRWCPNPRCRTERPYDSDGQYPIGSGDDPEQPQGVYSLSFRCAGCDSEFLCWIEVPNDYLTGEERQIRKVGQLPPYDISIPRRLDDALGEDALLYKRALICTSQSFGIGACTYLRRTLENQIVPLLQTVYEGRQENGASDEELNAVRTIMDRGSAEEKIRMANQVLPAAVRVTGENPLELIYDRLSAGLHRQNEQECTSIAKEVREALEHVFVSLSTERQQRRDRNRYAEIVRELRQRAPGGASTES